jgi:hypothetical protein
MPNLQHIGEDTNLHHFAMLGIHNLEHLLSRHAAFHQWLNERGLMTQYHDRLMAGEFQAEKPHYSDGENPSPVAEAEAPAEPQPEQPQPEPMPEEAQPEPEAPAEEVVIEETIVEEQPAEAPAEEAPPA